jgi:signal transduction histidine kinase/ActR/RegA family two-component response regulator
VPLCYGRAGTRLNESPSSRVPLRRRLVLLAAAGTLPLAVTVGVGLGALARQQREEARRVGLELARSVANAVDADLGRSTAVLEALATSPSLDLDDLGAFRERARRVLALQGEWAGISVADGSGTPLLDTRVEGNGPLPEIAERASFDRVLRERAAVVGSLARGPQGAWFFPVRAPVMRGGELRYVLTALVRPEEIRSVLDRERVPGNWVISVVDANGLRVARSRAHAETLGGRLSPTAQKVLAAGGPEGFGVSYTLEGERIFTPYSRLAASGWNAVLGIPTASVEGAMYRSLLIYGGGVLLSLLLGTLAALWVARSINGPIADLRAAAQALGRREPLRPPDTTIQEIRDVAAALASAGEERSRGEAERDELLRKEQLARRTAETADRAKEEFMAVLSHELRTPLNAVYGWARMLQAGNLADTDMVGRALDVIVRNSNSQVQLIDDLLDVSRIVTGKMRLDVRSVDMEAVLHAALEAVRPAADAKALRVQAVLDPRAGPVMGDPARLQQVAWNLLMNAVKFTPKGGRVQLHMRRVQSCVEVVVSDSGEGIAPEMLPHVFERFRQADSSTTRRHGGLGLGLALVKHLVELHGGTVTAHSAGQGQGATFTVTLPVAIAEVAPAPPPRAPGASAEPLPGLARLDGLRVLVADDDGEAVALAEAILTRAGAEVRTCRGASEAMDLLGRWRPDVLVSDIEMPGEDGYSLIRRIRALGEHEGGQTPAVALTAYGRPQDRTRSLAAGFNMHVPKPVDPGELTTIIASVAGQRMASR